MNTAPQKSGEKFYICRVWLDREVTRTRFSYLSKGYGWCKRFDEALAFDSTDAARIQLHGRPGSIWSESDLKASPYYQAEQSALNPKSMSPQKSGPETTAALQKTAPTEVVSAEQGKLIDRAKVYLQAEAVSSQHQRMYLFLIGATLIALKDCTPRGSFEDAKKQFFPEEHGSRLTRAMTYAESVKFFAKGKLPTIGNLADGDRLLTAGELSETEKETLVTEMQKVDKGGVMKTIQAWHNKKAPKPAEPKNPLKEHDEQIKNIEACFTHAAAALEHLIQMKDVDFVMANPAKRQGLADLCNTVSKRVKELKGKN